MHDVNTAFTRHACIHYSVNAVENAYMYFGMFGWLDRLFMIPG